MSDAALKAGALPTSARWLPRAGFGSLTAAMLGLTLLVSLLALIARSPSQTATAPPPVRPTHKHDLGPVWLDIAKPVRIYSLEAPTFSGTSLVYSARRLSPGDEREDVLALGVLGGARPALRLRMRRGSVRHTRIPLSAATAHEAAEAGLSVRLAGLPAPMPTRFGRFEVEPVTLAEAGGPAFAASCAGFELALDQPVLTVSGLACGDRNAVLSRHALACLIDRLDVASARDDRELIDFFAASELRRDPDCAGMHLGPDGLHAAWLDDKPATSSKNLRRR